MKPAPTPRGVTAYYGRVTREESAKGQSLSNQRTRYAELAERNGWVAAYYEEPKHVSGEYGPDRRPALRRLLAAIDRGDVVRVVVRHLDRLGRGKVLEELLELLQSARVELWDFSGQVDIHTAAGRLGVRVQAVVGAFEVERGGERVRESKRGRARQGVYTGPAPYGYTSQARERRELFRAYGDKDRARVEAQQRIPVSPGIFIDPDEAAVVREIYRLYIEKEWGSRRIANHLNDTGVKCRGRKWYGQTVLKRLRDPKVAGYTHYDEEAYEGHRPSKKPPHLQTYYDGEHEPIVSRDRWEAAQARLDKGRARRTAARENARHYPLSPVLRCAHGHGMFGKASGGRRPAYYYCARRARHGTELGCDAPTIESTRAETAVREWVAGLLNDPGRIVRLADAANEELARTRPARRRQADQTAKELLDLRQRRSALMNILETTTDTSGAQVLLGRVVELDKAIANLDARRQQAVSVADAPAPRRVTEAEVSEYLGTVGAMLDGRPDRLEALLVLLADAHELSLAVTDSYTIEAAVSLDVGAVGAATGGLRVVGPAPTVRVRDRLDAGERPLTVDEWVEREQGRHICRCGCGNPITVRPQHHAPSKGGIPQYIRGHHKMSMTVFVEALNAEGFYTVGQMAKRLGVGETSIRRMVARGELECEWRSWGGRRPMRAIRTRT